jgi:hypothetical protein
MDYSDNQLKQIVEFVNFNLHPHASFYNTVDGIVYSDDLGEMIKKVMDLLKRGYFIMDYSPKTDVKTFFKEFSSLLSQGKIVYINCHNLKLDPILYDQINQIRDKNKFNIKLDSLDLAEVKIHPKSKIFLLFCQNNEEKPANDIVDLTDHLLDLRKIN